MADHTGIEWTDATWNPVTGCTKVSPGCKNCYAERLAVRLRAMGNPRYRNGFAVTLQPDQIELPLRWRRPRRIFVNSMSDLFHEVVPEEYIQQVFEMMARAHWHIFQMLTKRSAAPRCDGCAPAVAAQCLAGCVRRECPVRWPGRSPETSASQRPIPLGRASPRAHRMLASRRNSLGHRRRREWARTPRGVGRLGPACPRPMHRGGRALLLQAMGRPNTQGQGSGARRPDLG